MFKEMRRKDRELSQENAIDIIKNGKYGVMALVGNDGYPYGVPFHYAFIDGDLYFHSSVEGGHKTECFNNNLKASFTIISTKNGIKARSAIVFGTIEILPDKKAYVLEKIVEKFVPKFARKKAKSGIQFAQNRVMAYRLKVENISGKFIDKPVKKK
jgi:nitroimidazol reductase NimA-like FMN-containing flavoprotein (pyridoxamine 5'-phosphate oxidase superfamily)